MRVRSLLRSAVIASFCFSFSVSAAQLAHRWSFNGDLTDSVGKLTAAKAGTCVAVYGDRVYMNAAIRAHGAGHIVLGTNLINKAAATLEFWARYEGARKWTRVFEYGTSPTNYFSLAWSSDSINNGDIAMAMNVVNGSDGKLIAQRQTMAPYELGADYYIAVTFRAKENGATEVCWQKRDTKTGKLEKKGSLEMPQGIGYFTDPVLFLGHSFSDNAYDAAASYDEVRIWNGVLSDDEMAASAVAGPNAFVRTRNGSAQFARRTPKRKVFPKPQERKPVRSLRIMSFNVRYCYNHDGTIIPERTADAINAEKPDYVAVQEIQNSNRKPTARALARETGMHLFWSNDEAILSREPPLSTETVQIANDSYKRVIQFAEFKHFVIANTHFGLTAESVANSLPIIKDAFKKYKKPILFMGDLNTRPKSANMREMQTFLTFLTPLSKVITYHGVHGKSKGLIDYIAIDTNNKDAFKVLNAYVVNDRTTSDHAPVVIDIKRK